MSRIKDLVGTVVALSFLYSANPAKTEAGSQPGYLKGEPRLELRASPRLGVAHTYLPFSWMVFAEIKGPESEKYYCPAVRWIYNEELVAEEESDCPPFEERYAGQEKGCVVLASLEEKVGEGKKDCQTENALNPGYEYPRIWSKRYATTAPGRHQVCVELFKGKSIITRQCVEITVQ